MRTLAFGVVVLVLAGAVGVVGADEPTARSSTQQQAAPQEQEPAVAKPDASEPQVSPEQKAAAEKLGLAVTITNSIGMKLVLIPPGKGTHAAMRRAAHFARRWPYVRVSWATSG